MFFVTPIPPGKIPIVDTFQDFMCKFGVKPHMHLVRNHKFFRISCHQQTQSAI